MVKNIFLVLTLASFGSIAGSIYKNVVEEKRNGRWKFYIFAFACFASAYFDCAINEMTFAYALKELSLSIVIWFGIVATLIATFLKGEKKAYGIIASGLVIPFSITCLILSCFGVLHWAFPLTYFAIPTIIFAALIVFDSIKEKIIIAE